MQTPKLSRRFWGLVIGWIKLLTFLKVLPSGKYHFPQQSRQTSQWPSRTSLVLEVLVAERFLPKHTEKLLLICQQSLWSGRNELWLFLECIGLPYCFALLLIYHLPPNTGKKMAGGVLRRIFSLNPSFYETFIIALFHLVHFFMKSIT